MASFIPQLELGSPLLAFGFGSLAMLGWLGAAAAPIVIHLWNRRKYREVPWAAMEYLLAALRKNARRIQIEQWILLAIRTLVIGLVALAAAQPFVEHFGLNFVAGQRTLKTLVIDGSYSMGFKPADKTRFERAKQLAAQLVAEGRQGDAFTLVLMAAPSVAVVATPAVEPRAFLDEIENLKMTHGGADLPGALAKVAEILQRTDAASLPRREVYFLSDLQRSTWSPEAPARPRAAGAAENELGEAPRAEPGAGRATHRESTAPGVEPSAGDYRELVEQLARSATLTVLDVGAQGGSENLAVTSLQTNEPFVTVGEETHFEAQVRNFGAQTQNHRLVECFVDGRRVKEAYVDVPAGEQVPLGFSHRFDAPADHVIEARLAPDLLEVDNHRWLSQPVKECLRVLCVSGKPSSGGMSGATDYLVPALNPEEDYTRRGVARPETIAESALVERELSRYDCVFLCNIGQFTSSEARLLDAYVRQGGGLVIFLGDQTRADRYNRLIGPDSETPLLPARILERVGQGQRRFDPLDYRHPLVAAFKGREQAGLLTTPIYEYFRLEAPQRGAAQVALGFDGGDPAIVEQPVGRGRVLLVATDGSLSSVDPAWPAWPSYLPMVQEMLAVAVAGQETQHNLRVGQSITEPIEPAVAKAPLAMALPDGRREELRATTDADGARWSLADTSTSGVYTLEPGSASARESKFAVNVDTMESNLARIDPADLPKGFTMNRAADLEEVDQDLAAHRGSLSKMLLYAALGLLFAETCLAWRFGNPRS